MPESFKERYRKAIGNLGPINSADAIPAIMETLAAAIDQCPRTNKQPRHVIAEIDIAFRNKYRVTVEELIG